uniref:amino acid adenylation domain-containing protein n=1 Tax=Methanobrevibacter sp. TaxID=66852 RepID=UPI00388DB6AC
MKNNNYFLSEKIDKNIENYIKFYNIQSDSYKNKKIILVNKSLNEFLTNNKISRFDFIIGIFSLYLSRVDRTKGCLIKSTISKNDLNAQILFKIDYDENISFNEHLNKINNDTFIDTEIDMDIDSFYSVYDLTQVNAEDININDSALTLNIFDDELELIYNTDLFEEIYIEHMLKNIASLIDNSLNNPNQLCKDLCIIGDEDKALIADFCKGDIVDIDKNKTLAQAFRENAIKYPNITAIDDGVNQITYGKMEYSTNSIAYDLKKNFTIGLGDSIALMLPRDYHFPELVLALNKIGATFIPIDSDYPAKRIEHMINIAQCEHIITTKEYENVHDFNINVIYIEDLNRNYDEVVECEGSGDDLFSIMFTSGTTGLPKGVMVPNKQIGAMASSLRKIYKSSQGSITGCYFSFSFIASFRVYYALYFGESCRILNERERKDSLLLIQVLENQPLNDIIIPPALCLPIYENENIDLKYLISVGSKLDNLPKKETNTNLVNLYGTTETAFTATKIVDLNNNSAPIGKPLDNTWKYILDENKNPVPVGVMGELYISRDYMSPGYYNRPDLTEKAFVENPYCDCEDNKIMYCTGDLAFYNFDGEIEIVGRQDNQLSVRGFRIESDEILKIMESFDSISEINLDVDNDNLIAYYTTNDKLNIDDVKNALKKELPPYMIPSLFLELDYIPLNVNGKVDKNALKKHNQRNADIEINDNVLKGVIEGFKKVLNKDLVLIDDDFVALGGNSLSSMKLQLAIKNRFNVSIASNKLIELSTPIQISNYIKSHLNSQDDNVNYDFNQTCPLSESQLNIYLDEITNNMKTEYNNPFKIEFNDYTGEEIKIALDKLFKIHPILTARILIDNDVPSFCFDAKPPIIEGTASDIDTFVQQFEFDKYLSRFLIVENEKSSILCMDCHHLIFDGTSLKILLNRLSDILNECELDFIDNGVLRQISFEENISSDYMDDAKIFMHNMLADIDEVHELMPSIDKDSEFQYMNTFDIDGNKLTDFLQNHSITRNQFFSSVFAYTLSRFTGSSKVLFNILEDGRGHIDHSQSIGMFVKTLPIIMDCKNQTVDSFLEYSSTLVNTVMNYDLYPFRFLANEFDLKFDISFQYAHNLFSTLLNKDDYGYSVNELDHDPEGDLTFFIFDVDDDELGIRILHTDKYSNSFIERFTKTYMLILQEMLSVDKLKEINYTENDDLKILDSFNQTEHDLKYNSVLDAFNSQLIENPDNSLTLSDDANYTYSQIAYIVNSLNSLLKQHEVVSNDNVVVFVDRNHWTLITALSCLSQGITYVPIDENHPDKRIEFMIRQSESKAIIVTDTFQNRVEKIDDGANLDLNIINISSLLDDVKTSNHVDYVDSDVNDVACILYTSGTTGNPKAVQMTTLGILNLIEYYVESTEFGHDDVIGIFASVGFDVSLEQFASVFTGGSVTYVPNDIRLNIFKLNDYFIKYGVTHTLITTQIAKLFVNTVSETSLKYLQTAGEKLGSIVPPKNYTLSDVYGPTEANYITSIDVDEKLDDSSVGMLNWNTKTYILDNEQRRVPFGAVGEIYLSGYQTTKGYFKNPEENKKALFQNPFDGKINGYNRIYKTGDLGRYLPDGSVAIIGRADSQVKIRGNRVELSEIELSIRDIADINDVTVQIIKNGENNELVAYVVAPDFKGDIVKYVKDYIGQHKPDYMVPSFVVSINEIPLNVNGKVDKKALPEVDFGSLHAKYAAPTNKIEEDIVNAFEVIFNQKISIYDNFSHMGGDSLTAIKIISLLNDYNITAADILNLGTPKAIAENINDSHIDLDAYSIDEGCPLNEPQLNVYLDIIANHKLDSYLIPLKMNIAKKYSIDDLHNALNQMVNVHPILKMCINDNPEVPYLVKGNSPEIIVKNNADETFTHKFLNKGFDLEKSLCKFLINEKTDKYELISVFHHIIFDGLSEPVFKQDLLNILNGNNIDVDDSFLKVSAFNQQIQKTEEYGEAKDYYDSMLAESDEIESLLNDVSTDGPGICKYNLDIDLKQFNEFISKNYINENVLFTSVFAYTLSRFTGNDKVLFNIVENGRDRFNNFDSIGMFVNTLPILADCKNQAVSTFMDSMSDLIYSVMRYNYYPFRVLANEYNINADIIFQYQPDWFNENRNDELYYEDLTKDSEDLINDLTVIVNQKDENYTLNIIYSDKYSEKTISKIIKTYNLILSQIIKASKLSDITYITKEDLELLDEYNKTEHDLKYNDILDAFNDNLSKYPNNKLVSYKDISYTYSESAFIAHEIAKKLIDLGVESQDCVGFLVPRSELYLLSVLGIMSCGATYVPLDDAHPDERIQFILNDTQTKVVIVSEETYERVDKLSEDIAILNISDIKEDTGTLSSLPVVYGDLACILYTSGTTGIPKGVKITRKSIVNLATIYQDKFNLANDDVYALFSTIGFDAALMAMAVVLYSGARLSVVPADIRFDMEKMNDYFISQNVTHTLITTQVGKLFIESVDDTSLKFLIVGGEKLGEFESPEDYILVDAFGPTEACVFIASIENADKIDSSSVGMLGYNTKTYVLDNEFRRVPAGAVGELYIAGYQIAQGYLNREEENKKAFLNNPFESDEDYNRLYRTGDMVRILNDGSIGVVGRRDSQVKIRGNRVELSEIESIIRKIDYVDDVTVQTVKHESNNELAAYIVLKDKYDEGNLEDAIRKYVSKHKPEYMVPSYIIELDKIPLNVNGKVDKRALPKVDFDSLHVEYVAPTNKIEKDIVNAFEESFNQEKISIYDNFSRLGGDSLIAIRVISQLNDYNITAADILNLGTPKAIAENINESNIDLDLYSIDEGCPLNEPQLNVYLDIIANAKVDSYLIPVKMNISKKYSVDTICDGLNEILNVHPILKMCISDNHQVPYLIKGNDPEIIVKNDADETFIHKFLSKGFDLEKSLCKFLINEKNDGYEIFSVFHHLIFDGLSEPVFKQDLLNILNGNNIDVDDSFLKVSAFNQQIQKTEEYSEAKDYYDLMLAENDEIGTLLNDILTDGPGTCECNLDIDLEQFNKFISKNYINENILFTSVFAYTLSRFAGNDKVLFNIVENGRDRFNNFDSIGMYVNTLPILANCKNQAVSEFIDSMSDLIYSAMRYNYYPFRLLANEYNIDADILFQYQPDWFNKDRNDDLDNEDLIKDTDDQISDLNVSVNQKDDNYTLNIIYSDKYSKKTIDKIIETYNLILSQIINVSNLSDISYITKEDLELLDEYNKTEHDLKYNDILDAFNDNLSKCPDNKLVSYNDNSYTYAEGAFIADKIAKKLIKSGIKPKDCISFLVDRSEQYMTCILAILSTGSVFVPLDDAHPDERIEFILKDTDSKAIIVDDNTYERAKQLTEDNIIILNISDIVNGNIGTLDKLNVCYGEVASILYTSGSTGVPKGVKVTRKSILNVAEYYADKYDLNSDDVYALYPSIGFDAGCESIFKAIHAGSCLSVVPQDIRLNMDELNNYFIKQNVTHTMITTQVGKLFMETNEDTSLKYLFVGGEKLGESESPKDYILVDEYGPTETNNFITSINNSDKIDYSSVGYLNYNSKYYILDSDLRRVPIGAVGELCLAGYQVSQGYMNREKETNESFITNPFSEDEDYSKIYRTGDLVRVLPDGSLGIVGRRDGQVKIRGNRVELTEVESTIRDISDVEDVTVQTIDNGRNKELVAYIVTSNDLEDNALVDYIQNHVNKYKPDYMVPSYVVKLDEIPINVNGKVNKKALPEVDLKNLRAEYVAPTNKTEEDIVKAFEEVFNLEKISVYDDFIKLGGDSLTAIKLNSYLKEYNISAADILSLHTPKAIANNISKKSFNLDKYSIERGCPLNEPQLNVYLDIIANDKTDSYLIPVNMNISKKYSIDDLHNALNEMINVHPILKMHVSDEFKVPYLVKGKKPEISIKNNIDDETINGFLNKGFNLYESLCRFLIVEKDEKYELFAVFHHLIFDGLSKPVFKRDLLNILDNNVVDKDESFLKVSAFNQEIQKTEEYDAAKVYFDNMLCDVDEVSVLLDDITFDGPGMCKIDLNSNIKEFIDNNNISENALFTGVFAYTLSRFTGGDKVLFNIVENGRDRFNNFDSIGMYVNTLPLMVDCKNQSSADFITYISNLIYGVMRYNYYPFRLLANEYDINSDIIFQYMPDWIGDRNNNIDIEEEMINDMSDFISDFNVDVIQNGDNYSLNIMYSDKYSEDTILRFAESYNLILSQITEVNNLSEINYITSSDLELLDSYNKTETEFEYGDLLETFNKNLTKYEDNILVGYNDISYTHGESAFIANEIAEQLNDLGIGKQDFVALFVDRSEWFLLASMGVLTAGAVYVPIEANYPEDRIILMLKDTKSGVVIVTDETEQDILDIIDNNSLDINVLNVSNITKSKIDSSNRLNIVSTDDEDIGCVLYTSGTTGTPKGTLITRKAINNFVSWYVDETSFTSEDIYGMHCSYVFDIHTAALYAPVIAGGSLYIVPEEIRLDLKALNDYYVEHNCTHTYITSQVGKLFAESGMKTTIKLLCFGGMKLGELNAPDSIGPFETYGPSENLAVSTSIFANKRVHHTSIGRFISNVKGYVLDDEHRRVPLGAVGELYLAGTQLTPGYLNREEENAKSFFDNPFDDEKGYEHIYSTGDMVRFLPDGTLAIVDRRDSQVKIRGNRVELPEVESAIRKIDYVDDVTVQVVDNNGNNELIAYVVASKEFSPDSLRDYIREYVSKHKPDYMVPSFIIPLNKIPLNVNGKVDKKALPKVNLEHLHSRYVAPVTKVQKIIVETFENVLNQDKIGLYDDFIRLGGDSIKAIRVISLLQSNDISCSAQDILNYKTPYLISKNVESISKVSYDAVEGIVDLHPIQSYFFDQINKNEFNQHFILKANQILDLNALQKAFDKLSNIHDMLRAKYTFEDNKPIQEIRPVNTRVCEINEIYSEKDVNETLMDIFMKAPDSLNVENSLIQIYLIHHNNESYVMFIIHHLIIDGISWSILIDDLSYLYYKIESGREIDLIRPYPYKLWVDNIKELADNISEEEKQHWIKINNSLDDSEICGPSAVFSFKAENNYNPDNIMGLTEEEYLALAIARAYKKTYGKNIIFNRESHGREERLADVSRTIGWFTSQYPVELDLINGEDNISLMLDVYKLKEEFKNINDLGLNYGSLIYLKNEFEYKHCPVTFNFLSTEFIFKNKLFESLNNYLSDKDIETDIFESNSYGITLNIAKIKDGYILGGDYAKDTYLGEKYPTFIENIKSELEFIGNYQFDDGLVCCLSEPQWGIYLDEKVHDKGIAYANPGLYECDLNCQINEIKDAVDKLIEKHPILKGRIIDNENMPLLVCDSYPQIEITNEVNFSKINDVFDLNESLARFYIVDDGKSKIIYYNIHHIISDATTKTVINNNLNDILNKKSDSKIDTGFIKASLDAFESKYKNTYEEAHDFFNDQFDDLNDITELLDDIDGHSGIVTLPVHGIREQMEKFAHENGITIGSLLNAIFAYTYSRFIGNDKVYFNFTENGRHEEYSQNALGMFVRTIPLVINCKNTSVKEYLNYVSDLILDSMLYSDYPYRLLANEFNLNNNVCFEYNHDLNDISDVEDGINIEDINFNLISDLLCVIYNLDDGYLIKVEHSNKFSRETMIRFAKAYKEVLTQILDKNELSDINYVCDEDLKLLDEINETEHELKYNDILDAFNDNLSRYPNNNFVSFKDKTYSYEESAFIANKIAEKLKEMDVKINDSVGFLTERSEYYMFSILAILSIGATYVPLDDALPDNRLSFILNDTQSKVVIVSDETEERTSNLDSDCTILNISEIINDAEDCLTHLPVIYGDLACILYTSGTTGIPKGVKITRKSIVNYI